MNRCALFVMVVLALLSSLARRSYGWGAATHAYIAKELGETEGVADLQMVYGAVLPDMFNLMFGDPYQQDLWTQTHYEFMKVVEEAESDRDRALAYGFASHNEAWGADRTAHVSSIANPETGYVIEKQDELAAILEPQVRLFLLFSGVGAAAALAEELTPIVAHSAVETAVDWLITDKEDPQIGERMRRAALTRGLSVPILLSKAYAADFAETAGLTDAQATSVIVGAELEFREQIKLYGTLLGRDDSIEALAEQGAEQAELLLAARSGMIIDVPTDLTREILTAAIDVVKDDYAAKVAATIVQVQQELASHGVEAGAP